MHEIKCPHCGTRFTIDESGYAAILKQIKDHEFEQNVANAVTLSLHEKDQQITKLQAQIEQNDLLRQTEIAKVTQAAEIEAHKKDQKIQDLNDQVAHLRDMKAKLSTKMLGESLEQHCNLAFNTIRPLLPRAYFEKDNDAKDGTKGDFIFRDYDDQGLEYVSIMFEMKNQDEDTKTKHKNEDFFKKLDADRNAKKCEFAVLVSLLETDSELYNTGIVDVSYKYPKMYVIRPQFFTQMITLLTTLSQKSLDYKRQLVQAQNQAIDITNFEAELDEQKAKFNKFGTAARTKFEHAIDQINKAIDNLTKMRDDLILTNKNIAAADNLLADLTIKKLTKNNPTMQQKFNTRQ